MIKIYSNETIREMLIELKEPEYQAFAGKLLPTTNNLYGVRIPHLRKMAKELVKGDFLSYLDGAFDDSFEEVMLQGLTIGYIKTDFDTHLSLITRFVDKIDNWSVCDSFCSGLKLPLTKKESMWEFLLPFLSSKKEFHVRFGVVMLLDYYIDEIYIDNVLLLLDQIHHPAYYVTMAVAWAISMCFISFPDKTMAYLHHNSLENDTYNKAIQKIIESRKVNDEMKRELRLMKRR